MAALTVFVDVLAGHDRVVDHDPQSDDKGKHGDDIDRNTQCGQKQQAAEEGDRDPHGHPEGELELEKQAEQ